MGPDPTGPLLGTPVPGAPVKVSPQRKPKQVAARSFSVAGRFNLNRVMLVVVQLLMLLWVVLAVLTARPWAAPHGLPIRTVRPGVKLLPAAGIMPLRIRVLGGSESNYRVPMRGLQIGSQIIDRTHFSEFLRREIPKRPSDWPVYIEADRDLEYESVAWTIDAVSAFRAKVILLTPGLKADLGEPAR